jgi:uncharacterized phosphosugar-binding protein
VKASEFLDLAVVLLKRVRESQLDAIHRAAEFWVESIEGGGLVHVFGSGHSSLVCVDMYARAGGLVPINWIMGEDLLPLRGLRSGALERLPGLAAVLLDFEPIRRGDTLVIVSNSGRNTVPVEMAESGRERGLRTVGITSLNYSRHFQSRAPSGKHLSEVVDVVIDNLGAIGDAAVTIGEGSEAVAVAPTSTVIGAAIVQAITAETAERLAARGTRPPVLISANVDDSEHHNCAELVRLRQRMPSLLAGDISRLVQADLPEPREIS